MTQHGGKFSQIFRHLLSELQLNAGITDPHIPVSHVFVSDETGQDSLTAYIITEKKFSGRWPKFK